MTELLVLFGLLIGDIGHALLVIAGVIYLVRIYHAAARNAPSAPDFTPDHQALPSTASKSLPGSAAHELDVPDLKALGWRK